jgi:hypothetical protein
LFNDSNTINANGIMIDSQDESFLLNSLSQSPNVNSETDIGAPIGGEMMFTRELQEETEAERILEKCKEENKRQEAERIQEETEIERILEEWTGNKLNEKNDTIRSILGK